MRIGQRENLCRGHEGKRRLPRGKNFLRMRPIRSLAEENPVAANG